MQFPYILAIIDMQNRFRPANKAKTIANVVRLCELAKQDNALILVVEYARVNWTTLEKIRDTPTHDEIFRAIGAYPHSHLVLKTEDDGSQQIVETCNAIGVNLDVTPIHFCGVNYQFCVRDTVVGVVDKIGNAKKISVIKPACNGPRGQDYTDAGLAFATTSRHFQNLGIKVVREMPQSLLV